MSGIGMDYDNFSLPWSLPPAKGGGGGGFQLPMVNSMNPIDLMGGPVGIGMGVASQLFSFLGGGGTRKRKQETYDDLGSLYDMALGERGKDVLDIPKTMDTTRAAMNPRVEEFGKKFDERFGFDSGAAGEYLAKMIAAEEPAAYTNLSTTNSQLKNSRDLSLWNLALGAKQAQGQYV